MPPWRRETWLEVRDVGAGPAAASVDLPSWDARKPTLGCPFSARGSSTELIEVPAGELARLRRVEREPRDRHAGTPVTAGNER